MGAAECSNPPKVSIIIPCYNVARYIGEALDSVRAQTFTDYEIILINDGSPDTEEFERVIGPSREQVTYVRQANRGLAGARNTGLLVARGEYIALLDPDDIWLPDFLAVQTAELDRCPSLDVIYSNARIFGHGGRELDFMSLLPSEDPVTFEKVLRRKCYVMGAAVMRRATILRVGMYDQSLRACEDFDLWLRVAKQGRIAFNRHTLVKLRRRPDSLSANDIGMYEHLLRILDKVEHTMELSPSEQSAVEQQRRLYLAQLRLFRGKKALSEGDAVTAREELRLANDVLRRRKIAWALTAMKISPALVRLVHAIHGSVLQVWNRMRDPASPAGISEFRRAK